MTSFIEKRVNEICGRWLDGFTKDNVDVSLLQANITLSDLHFKTDELCLLSPTFAPSFFYVGKLSVDIPLAWTFSRPVKILVSDILGVFRVCDHDSMTAEDIRKSISANVHVKALLSKLAEELGGGGADAGKKASRINLQTAHNLHKVMRKLEVSVKNVHVRVEEPCRKMQDETSPSPAVALGVCVRGISLGLDERDDVERGGGSAGKRWFGKKFRAMETALLGNFSRVDAVDGALGAQVASDSQRIDARTDTRSDDGVNGASAGQPHSDQSRSSSTLEVIKFASVRGASVYFCRDDECYRATDREETLRRLREDLKSPPATLPPLLRRCRAGLGLNVVLSAEEWGKIESVDVRILAGDINVQVGDDHLGYLLRWASLLNAHERTLALSALRPVRELIPSTLPNDSRGRSERSRYYRALWGHAVAAVLRDLRSCAWLRSENASKYLQSARAARSARIDIFDRSSSSEKCDYRTARGLLWRTWFAEWVGAARYLSLRQLLQASLVVESFSDESGGIHNRLFEDLEVQPTPSTEQGKAGSGSRISGSDTCKGAGQTERKLAKHLMPWQLPQEDVDKAWSLINRETRRWELRHAGGIKLAIDEERADQGQLNPAVLQALWSIQLQLDAQLPHRVCAFCRRMAFLRVGWRTQIDALWQARAEKQRRLGLGLGEPPTTPRITLNDSFTPSELGSMVSSEAASDNAADTAAAAVVGDGGDGADRVGTLLVRVGQLDGMGGVGMLSLAPKAIATLMLEESSATIEEMDLETNITEVARYDQKNDRCCWDQIFRLQVELSSDYAHGLRIERMRRHRKTVSVTSNSNGSGDRLTSSNSSSPVESDGLSGSHSFMKDNDARYISGRSHRESAVNSPTAQRSRTDSMDSTQSQIVEAVPCSSFLLSVACFDKGVFGVAKLGTMTLPGKQLTAVPLKVLEHRCALFSPSAVSRQPRELTIETIFVPPGDDVALAEQELLAIGKRRRLQENLDMVSKSSFGWKKAGRGSPSEFDASVKPPRTSLDNVGEREVKVLSLVSGSSSKIDQNAAADAQGGEAKRRDVQRSIPIVDTDMPGKVEMTMRVAGVTVVTYLNSSAASARAGGGEGLWRKDKDMVVTLTDTSARQIEACAEIDLVRGTFALTADAATINHLDKGLLQATTPGTTAGASASLVEAQEANFPSTQLIMVGPVGVEMAFTRYVRPYGDAEPEMGVPQRGPATSTPPALGSQLSSYQTGRADTENANGAGDGDERGRPFLGVLETWPTWDWRGRFKIGAYTAELGSSQEGRSIFQEVWRHFRFSMPKSALEDTQVLRGGTTDPFGAAQSSIWLLRAGARGLAVEVQMPPDERSDVSHAPSPNPYVYVSSSESEACSPPSSPSSPSPSSPTANGEGGGTTPSRYFPSAEGGDSTVINGGSVAQAGSPLPTEVRFRGEGVLGGSTSRAVGQPCGQVTPTNAELARRVQELEEELKALRATAPAASSAASTATANSSTPVASAGSVDAPEA